MQGVVSSNDDMIVEKSKKKDIVNNEVASIPAKAIDLTNENNEKEESKEIAKVEEVNENEEVKLEKVEAIEVDEVVEVPDGHVLDKNGNAVPVVEVDDSDIPVVNPSDYIKDENVNNSNNNGGNSKPSVSKPVEKPVQKPSQDKPVQKPSQDKPQNKPSVDNTKPQEPSKPSKPVETPKPEHTHNWVAVTEQVKHDEVGHWETVVIKETWTESVPVYEEKEVAICNGCGADITNNIQQHMKDNALAGNTACGGWHSEWKQVQTGTNTINHPAVTDKKWIVDKAAWVETVTKGHTCSGCGAKK